MADNKLLPATGTGDAPFKCATDEVTYSGETADVQLVRLVGVTGSEGSKTVVEPPPVDSTYGMAVDVTRITDPLGSNIVKASATPTITAGAYATGDVMGAALTFSNVVSANGLGGKVVNAIITNRALSSPVLELWVFRVSPTLVNADNGAFDLTDANLEAGELIGIIDFVTWYNTAAGQATVGQVRGVPLGGAPLAFVAGASDDNIYGAICTRSAQTQTGTTDLVITLTVER